MHYQGDVFGNNVSSTKIVSDSKLNRVAVRHLQRILFLTGILLKQCQSNSNMSMIVAIGIILAETFFNIVNIHIVRITVAFTANWPILLHFLHLQLEVGHSFLSSAPFPLEQINSLNLLSMRFWESCYFGPSLSLTSFGVYIFSGVDIFSSFNCNLMNLCIEGLHTCPFCPC